jgi:hypothetical protein
MNLAPVATSSIRLNHPLPYHLVDKRGVLIAKKGFVVESEKHLLEIAAQSGGLFIDVENNENQAPKDVQRAFVEELQTMVRKERSLGEIANTRVPTEASRKRAAIESDRIDWLDLQVQCNSLLRNSTPETFDERLETVSGILAHQLQRNPDGVLFALIYLSASEIRMYSATHSMLVAVICALAAKDSLSWPSDEQDIVFKAALTMNLGMSELQDRLAAQRSSVDAFQRTEINAHCEKSVELLTAMGVKDALWLDAVLSHHGQIPGPLAGRSNAERLARLIHRADLFAARLAPRATRQPSSATAIMKACYFDELGKVDEAGTALLKVLGIHQPGTFVKLVSGEIAAVARRGENIKTPKVAVILNRDGGPVSEPYIRDTAQKAYSIEAGVQRSDVKVNLNLERMLALTT